MLKNSNLSCSTKQFCGLISRWLVLSLLLIGTWLSSLSLLLAGCVRRKTCQIPLETGTGKLTVTANLGYFNPVTHSLSQQLFETCCFEFYKYNTFACGHVVVELNWTLTSDSDRCVTVSGITCPLVCSSPLLHSTWMAWPLTPHSSMTTEPSPTQHHTSGWSSEHAGVIVLLVICDKS